LQDEPTEIEIAYIAGLLEGEGTFLRKGNCPIIQVGMTDDDVIEKAAKIINIGNRKIHIEEDKRPNYKTKYIICLAGRDAMRWMKLIRPHMCSRRGEEIDNIIEDILEARPFYELGKDYCKNGHSIRYACEYFQHFDGARRCKRCVGVKPKYPLIIPNNPDPNYIFINPFEKVS
jgi:hypothetical protein